jgi:hypothetical protein
MLVALVASGAWAQSGPTTGLSFASAQSTVYQNTSAAPYGVGADNSGDVFFSLTISVCTASGKTVTLIRVGVCSLQATQAGNANYFAASPVNQSFQVVQASQTITFPALSNRAYGTDPFPVSATASSGLPVTFASLTAPVCNVAGNTVTLLTTGACTIQATQAGNADYLAATAVTRSFQVTKDSQTISFGVLASQSLSVHQIALSATATSSLPLSFASKTKGICTVTGSTSTLLAVGTCAIQATQPGDADYLAATPVSQSFQVTQ